MHFLIPIKHFKLHGAKKHELTTAQKLLIARCLFYVKDYQNIYFSSRVTDNKARSSVKKVLKLDKPIMHVDIYFNDLDISLKIFHCPNDAGYYPDESYCYEYKNLNEIDIEFSKNLTRGQKQTIEKIMNRELKIFKELG